MKVIDTSMFNTFSSWAEMAKDCDGIIIRCGYRGYGSSGTLVVDSKFRTSIESAIRAGIPVGVYWVTQAINIAEAVQEANFVLSLIKPYKLSFPIMIDEENGNGGKGRADAGKLSAGVRTAITKAWCRTIEAAGYKAGIYASESWFTGQLVWKELTDYFFWVAKYSSTAPRIPWNAWQYTDKGQTQGVNCMHGKNRCDVSTFRYNFKPGAKTGGVKIVGVTKKGMSGVQVKGLQTMLKEYGYYSATIDGSFGDKTEAAVKAFQKAEGLDADGLVGEKTWARLAGLA